jgi:uncharacterized membrane protein YedE/YeeE
MDTLKKEQKPTRYINSYLGGVLLGLLLLATYYITGRGLGASGAIKSAVVATVETITPVHAEKSNYYSQFITDDSSPLSNWLVFEVLGVLAGALLTGTLAGRLKLKVEHAPVITARTRIIFALVGGMLFGIGSQFARGCTSGAALTGSASLALAGILAMMMIFGTGYALAYFFRKLWK